MRPGNTHTSPEVKFYFPDQAEAEYNTSISLEDAPNVIHLEGENHIVIYGGRYGVYLHNVLDTKDTTKFGLPTGAKLKQVVSLGEVNNLSLIHI